MDWGVAKLLVGDPQQPTLLLSEPTSSPQPSPPSTPEDRALEDPTAAAGSPGQTLAGTIFGTPAYLPPEQARGELDRIDYRADVFGLGSILCEILTGRAPFTGDTDDERRRLAAAGKVEDAFERLESSRGPLPLIRLAKQCMAADPEARPADAGEVAAAVTQYLESGQRRAEQELVQFFDLTLDLFCIASLKGTFHRLNDNVTNLLGYQAENLINQPFLDYVHPNDQERTQAELAELAEKKSTLHFLNRYRHADGHYVWLEWNAHAVVEEGAVYAVARDVSDRMAAQALREKMERERETIASFTAAAGLFLTAPGTLTERLRNVVEEGTAQLGLLAMEVWLCNENCTQPQVLVSSNPDIAGISPETVNTVVSSHQPQHLSGDDITTGSVVGYPLVVGHRAVGLLAIYAEESLSEMHVTALTTTVASVALAVAAEG